MARELCLDDRDPQSKDATKLAPASDDRSTGVKSPDDDEQSIHVLAVDDSLLDRKVIERLLKTSSYRVTTVDSGRRALEVLGLGGTQELVNSNQIHLIITDYCMPEMSGYDLLKKVKENPALKDIPVVIMSSENVPSRIQMCLTDGAEEFILKPVRMTDVKRLKDYVNLPKQVPLEPSGSSCNKRKFGSDGCQAQSPERRPRLSGVTVA